jgi:serine/threonine protein phosphatase PrpC
MNIYYTSIKGRRESNEDRHNIILNINKLMPDLNKINLLGIYDGHGGIHVSEFLEKNIPLFYCHKRFQTPFSEEYHIETFDTMQ